MNLKEIKELVELVSRRGIVGLEIERAGFRLRIEGAPARPAPVFARAVAEPAGAEALALPPVAPATVAVIPHVPPGPPGSGEREGFHVITAPIVGTGYDPISNSYILNSPLGIDERFVSPLSGSANDTATPWLGWRYFGWSNRSESCGRW